MAWIRTRTLAGEVLLGFGAQLGAPVTAELAGRTGFDWVWVDLEHGLTQSGDLAHMMRAADIHDTPAIVRLPANELPHFKQALDMGAAGVMIPYVNTPEEAAHAVSCTRFAPAGLRGVAQSTRAAGFSLDFERHFATADDNILVVVQVETREALANADAIAAVDGVDVVFVGPLDLTTSMGVVRQFDHPEFAAGLETVLSACRKHRKAPGILAPTVVLGRQWRDLGFTFIVAGADGSMLARGMSELKAAWSD